MAGADQVQAARVQNQDTIRAYLRTVWMSDTKIAEAEKSEDVNSLTERRKQCWHRILAADTSKVNATIVLDNVAKEHKCLHDKYKAIAKKLSAARKKDECEDPKRGVKAMAKTVKESSGGSLNFLKIDGKNDEPPKYITDPAKMDNLLREKWGKIYDGNHENYDNLTKEFCEKYDDYIYTHEEVKVPPITAEEVYEVFKQSKKSAAGLDSWEPAEFRLFSMKACSWVARLYNMIELSGK